MSFVYRNVIFILLPCSDKRKRLIKASLNKTPEKWCISCARKNNLENGAIFLSNCLRRLCTTNRGSKKLTPPSKL